MTRGAVPPVRAVQGGPPLRARCHLAWVLALARWVKGWAERVLAEHAAALAEATAPRGGARVRSLPVREPEVVLLPVPLWPPRLEPSSVTPRMTPVSSEVSPEPLDSGAPTPRPNALRCVPMPEGPSPFDLEPERGTPPRPPPGVPFGFDPDDILPAEPVATVSLRPDPAALLQAAAIPLPDVTEHPVPAYAAPGQMHHEPPVLAPAAPGQVSAARSPAQAVPLLQRDPARELLTLLQESEGTPTQPPVPWLEVAPPPGAGSTDAQEVLRQCARLELETPGD
ncbi:hypothetical protein G4177_20655 [Corallococcus sp. ZKHCc1 1396]|uniref:Uncharacterized protein n=1 Tax=Corallococcus soli TaxID=2710757 RepID=A0ABR9PRP7_9BACT|nr:hypothetical protein [Corallococcus soli]MBE4750583.1 hypothetical protein [Corallococcus soli]